MRRLAELGGPEWIERVARAVGSELSTLGLNVNFAPVVDVDTNPENPVIGDRALGREPERVVALARAYLRGLRQGGVAGCLKHFPGHGDTREDSHVSLPFVPHALERLEAVELEPFRALSADADCVMTAHVVYPALDPRCPATLSRPILVDILRRRFGFAGLVFSDDLEMQAIAARGPLAAAAEQALLAGCDSLLVCHREDEQERVHHALTRRLGHDPDFRRRAREAAFRSLGLRLRFPPPDRPWSDFERLERDELRPLQLELDELTGRSRSEPGFEEPLGERRWDDGG
jgi:beta-N-acetylhexosaminidase